jgi:hypothetical protein
VIDVNEVNAAVALLSTVAPEVTAAYSLLKVIWMRTNPGKTEDDYRAYLRSTSHANIDDSAAILRADGFEPDGAGGWKKPV